MGRESQTMSNFHWTNIISLNSSQNDAFEELLCQLVNQEPIEDKQKFVKVGNPDGGVECYIILKNGDEIGFQAKWFLSTPQEAQWNQVEHSFKTALEKHPKMITYYVAIPLDRADPRVENRTSFMKKWKGKVEKWQKLAKDKYGREIEFVYWGSSEFITRLSREENAGLKSFFFGDIDLSDKWFKNQNELAIKDLGARYTPEINIELDIVENFDAISRNDRFKKKLDEAYHDYMLSYRKFLEHLYIKNENLESLLARLSEKVEILEGKYDSISFYGIDYINHEQLNQFFKEIEPLSYEISELLDELNRKEIEEKKITTSHGYRTATAYDRKIKDLTNYLSNQYKFKGLINSTILKLSNNPFVVLDGDAGIGKSHLLADIVNQRLKDSENSVFLLGQHFREDKSPWSQILKELLELNCTKEKFLGALNAKAEGQNKRIIIFIDAINEGKGRSFWSEFLVSFIESIKQYEWLGLVLSIRSSYFDLIVPKEIFEKKLAIPITHFGFDGVEYNASRMFFENYNILQPAIPLLHPEFSNPLFLKLFCEGLNKRGLTQIPDGYEGITNIIKFFIGGIEEKLSKKYTNIKSLKLIDKVIDTLITEMLSNQTMAYDKALEIVIREVSSKYGIGSGLLDDLISEGLLTKNSFYDGQEHIEGVYFAYERFEDHIKVKYLFDKYLDKKNSKRSFEQEGLSSYFEEHNLYYYQGIIDAMSIQLPEVCNVELIDVVDQNEVVIESFFDSLLWRKADSITPEVSERILKNISNEHFQEDIFKILFSTASNPKHPLNADILHDYLLNFSMKERDVFFIPLLNSIYLDSEANPIKRLIDWAWSEEPKSYISDDSILLTSIALSWLLVSSNRQLRDYATKALISALQGRVNVVLNLLRQFENVNDPYVYERLFAVGFGVVVRLENKNGLKEFGKYIYKTIFNVDEVYPHILLRDYAKNTIEYIDYLGIELDIDLKKVKPPYKSYLPPIDKLPTEEDIEKFQDREGTYHQSRITSSMMTEYGHGTGGYGDFGRYVFGSALHDFDCRENEQLISNYAIRKIFEEYEYDGEFFDKAEKAIQEHNRHNYDRYYHEIERIGKKYQWIAMYDTLARMTDNFKMYKGYGDNKQEVKYQGTFEPYVRDIDPTILLKKTGLGTDDCQANWCNSKADIKWTMDHDKWVQVIDDLPNPFDIVNLVDDKGEEWISLHAFPMWREPTKKGYDSSNVIRKEVWYILNSYLIPNDELDEFVQWSEKQHFWNDWMPSGKGHYQMLNREHYWSDAYKFLQDPYYGCEDWSYIDTFRASKYPHKIGLTYNAYYWEEQFDYSKEESLGFFKPSKILFDGLQMQYSSKEGEFINDENKLVCFDAKMKYSSFDSLLFNKRMLVQYLQENNLSLYWTIIGEKQIFVPMNNREDKVGLMQMNGYYFMKENMEKGGKMNIMSMDKDYEKTYQDIELT